MQVPPHISHPIPGGLLTNTTRTAAYLYVHQYIWITFKKRYLRSSRPKHFGSSSIRQKSNNTRKEASEQHDHAQNEALAFVGNHVQARYCLSEVWRSTRSIRQHQLVGSSVPESSRVHPLAPTGEFENLYPERGKVRSSWT